MEGWDSVYEANTCHFCYEKLLKFSSGHMKSKVFICVSMK